MVFISEFLIFWVPGSEIGQNVGVGVLRGNSWSQARMDGQERVWFCFFSFRNEKRQRLEPFLLERHMAAHFLFQF